MQAVMLQYINRHRLLNHDSKILAAVSGGIDSMVMLKLLHDAGFNIAVAHCNFGLRGEESYSDEAFVKTETEKLGIKCHTKCFDTAGYAVQNGISIQMAARELRYEWFHELASSEGYGAIAIAHNADDSIETLFINLARGTGIHGLTGIKPQNGKIVRPLLFASRREIEAYAKSNIVRFREDSSNNSDKYARNFIRNNVIPGMEHFFPEMRQSIVRSLEQFSAAELFYNEAIERYKNQIVTTVDNLIYIDLQGLAKSPSPPTLLYEILKPFGFSSSTAARILDKKKYPSGRQFFSEKYRIVQDRKTLIIQESCQSSVVSRQLSVVRKIEKHTSSIDVPIRLKIDKFDKSPEFKPETDPNIACLDGDKLQFPLLLRNWKKGDKFHPLGMRYNKKLSDFFSDAKLSLIEKEKTMILESNGKIAWIVGYRIDDRFKITDKTKKVVMFQVNVNI